MQRVFIYIFLAIFFISPSFAFEMVLPKEKKFISNSQYAFFVGKANRGETITINDDHVYVAPNGAFAHSIKLKNGENRIALKSNYSMRIYRIYKNKQEKEFESEFKEFEPATYEVLSNNTPLRNTPIDYGMNRISHLFEGTKLIINGEKDKFYRVFLSKNKTGWIAKDAVKIYDNETPQVKFLSTDSKTYKNASVHKIEFTEKLPYTIEETRGEVLFRVYNPFVSDESVYTLTARKPEKYIYKTTLENGSYVFKVNEFPYTENALDGINIFIDPGHGGSELGAIGCLGDKEKDINLKIAMELKNILTVMGANVKMSRECDGFVSLEDRVTMAKEHLTDIFVSIHLNSIPDIKMDIHKNRGTSVYYYNPNSKALAEAVLNSVTNGIKTRNDGVRTASFAVIRPADYVGVLVETAYMTNPLDSTMYTQECFPRETAKSIADGIYNYVYDNVKE